MKAYEITKAKNSRNKMGLPNLNLCKHMHDHSIMIFKSQSNRVNFAILWVYDIERTC